MIPRFLKWLRYGRKKVVHIDEVIQDNMEQIKQIRMNRMKFYRYYKKAVS